MRTVKILFLFFFWTYPLPRVLSTLAGLPSVLILLWGARVACSRCRSRNISLAGYWSYFFLFLDIFSLQFLLICQLGGWTIVFAQRFFKDDGWWQDVMYSIFTVSVLWPETCLTKRQCVQRQSCHGVGFIAIPEVQHRLLLLYMNVLYN